MPINAKHPRRVKAIPIRPNSSLLVNVGRKDSPSKPVPTHCIMLNEHEAVCLSQSSDQIHVDDVVEIVRDHRSVIGKVSKLIPVYPNNLAADRMLVSGTGDGSTLYKSLVCGTGDGTTPTRPPRPWSCFFRVEITGMPDPKRAK